MATIVAGMIAGADSIDDLDVVRHGGMGLLFGGVYAPSTLGTFLRGNSITYPAHALAVGMAATGDVILAIAHGWVGLSTWTIPNR